MQLTLQATLSCHACGHASNPVNGLVERVECRGCGAELSIHERVWAAALEGVRYRAASLAENARGHELLRSRGGQLRIGYARIASTCPHCSATWSSLPEDACDSCSLPISRRPAPVAVEGVRELLAEDRALVHGADAAGLDGRVQCGSCGSPLELGDERRVRCEACGVETVVPDEQWRRAKAPELAARWIVVLDAEGTAGPLDNLGIESMAVGPDGTVFIVGSEYPLDVLVTALDARLQRRLWTHELDEELAPHPVPLADGRVALVPEMGKRVTVADADGVQELLTLEGDDIVDGTRLGQTLVLARGHFRQLHRYDPSGAEQPMWPPVGFFKRLFGADGPMQVTMDPPARPRATMTGRMGSSEDGALLLSWGPKLVRYDGEGQLEWQQGDGSWAAATAAPVATPDGAVWCSFMVAKGDETTTRLVRVPPGGGTPEQLLEYQLIGALAASPDGTVLAYCATHVEDVGTLFELLVLDSEGDTVRTLPVNR